jgi:hypothetical protein
LHNVLSFRLLPGAKGAGLQAMPLKIIVRKGAICISLYDKFGDPELDRILLAITTVCHLFPIAQLFFIAGPYICRGAVIAFLHLVVVGGLALANSFFVNETW